MAQLITEIESVRRLAEADVSQAPHRADLLKWRSELKEEPVCPLHPPATDYG
jgi:hypothetical protein